MLPLVAVTVANLRIEGAVTAAAAELVALHTIVFSRSSPVRQESNSSPSKWYLSLPDTRLCRYLLLRNFLIVVHQ